MRVLVMSCGGKYPRIILGLLRASGFACDEVESSQEVLDLLPGSEYDLLVVRLDRTAGCGPDAIRVLRRRGCGIAIMGLSVTTGMAERVEALNAGADDCVPEITPPLECVARVRALMRRPRVTVGPTYSFGNLTLDAPAAVAKAGAERVQMPRREVSLLELLMRAGGSPVPRERLEHALFSYEDAVTPNALEAAISRLRRRLKDHGSDVTITARRGFGYSLERAVASEVRTTADVASLLPSALTGPPRQTALVES